MYADYAARLTREDWSKHVRVDQRQSTAIQQDLKGIADALRELGASVSLSSQGTPNEPLEVPGVDMLAQEFWALLGKEMPLTHRERLHIVDTLPPGDTEGLVLIDAFQDNGLGRYYPIGLHVRNGRIVGRISGSVRLATATADWVDAAVPTVAATDNETTDVIEVKIYRNGSKDPCILSGDEFLYAEDADGVLYALDGLDVPIGSIRIHIDSTMPAGWDVCDGSTYAGPMGNVVSPDMTGRFVKGSATTTGTPAAATNTGSASTGLTATGSADFTGLTIGGTTELAEIGGITAAIAAGYNTGNAATGLDGNITVSDHDAPTTAQADTNLDGASGNFVTAIDATHEVIVVDNGHVHTIPEASVTITNTSHNHPLDIDLGSLSPTITVTPSESPHAHVTGDPISATAIFIIRYK